MNTPTKERPPKGTKSATRCGLCWLLFGLILAMLASMVLYAAVRFLPDQPVVYADPEQHFKYGSTGGERESGFPYWIWKALPKVCGDYLPGEGYASLGLLYEEGADLPIGMSKRRVTGIDRVFLNCAVCHTSTYRTAADTPPEIVTGMPANTFRIMDFERFFFNCAADPRFSAEWIVPRIEQLKGELSPIDRYLVYPLAIHLMRERLLMLKQRLSFIEQQPDWGPGRVDTFTPAKALFNFRFDRMPRRELIGTADFPSIWNQRQREGMQLHWDGNNDRVGERNKSAAFGTGTTPPTIDLKAIGRIEDWLLDFEPPGFPFPIDHQLAARGKPIYGRYCAECHGLNGDNFQGDQVGQVVPIEKIGTDRWRLDSYTRELSVNQSTLYAGYPWRFSRFRKTFGYTNMPLDGLWLRAPYLHNGSVPTLRNLLEPAAKRPTRFYRGNDLYDPQQVGFVYDLKEENGRPYFQFDTSLPGNGNQGHEGPAYGTELAAADKQALVEYLKTF